MDQQQQENDNGSAGKRPADQLDQPRSKDLRQATTTSDGTTVANNNNNNMYLVICNISKRPNVKALFLTAAAFGCKGVFVVGQKLLNTDVNSPDTDVPYQIQNHVRDGKMTIDRFAKFADFVEHVKSNDIRLIGVEIHKDAKPIDAYFDNNHHVHTAFLMGNEGQGLSDKQMQACDGFVRIPQYGNGTASLNVYVASSIILQRYNQWQLGL